MATKLFGDVKAGATSVSRPALLLKTADGTPDTGKVAADLTAYYYRQGANATAPVTLSDLANLNTAFAPGGVKEIADGAYRVDWPDLAFAAGADFVLLTVKDGATSAYTEAVAIEAHGADDVFGGMSTYAGADTAGTGTLLARLTSTRAGYLDNLSVAPLTTLGANAPDGWLRTATFTAGTTLPRVTLADTTTALTNAPASGDFTAAMKASLNAATPSISNPESLTGTVVSATTTSVTISAGSGTVFNTTTNAYGGGTATPTRYLAFTGGANKGQVVAVTGSSYSAPNLTLNFAATTGVIAATAGDTVQVD